MKTRKRFDLLCLVGLAALALSLPLAVANADVPPATLVHVTPPAPVFDDAKRIAELALRRQQIAEAIGPKAMLVMFSTEPRVYTNDVDFPFRQENNHFYLTSLNQKRATLVLIPSHNPS